MADQNKSERMKALWAMPEFREKVKAARASARPRRKYGELKAEREERRRRREIKRIEQEQKREARATRRRIREQLAKMPPLMIAPSYCPRCLGQVIRGECWCEK